MQRHSSDSEECEFHQIHSQMPTNGVEQAQSISGYLKNAVTNLAYNLKHSNYLNIPLLQRPKIVLTEGGEEVCYLGRLYGFDSLQQFNDHFRNTLWLSYRKGIKDIGDDRGWGCMIRAVQMLMAEAIRRLCGLEGTSLIDFFLESQTSILSLVNICRVGGIQRRWTSASEIVDACSKIVEATPTLNLKIINSISGCLIPQTNLTIDEPTVLVVHNRLGIDSIDERFFPHLKALMQLSQFSGMLGGTPGQALFILGYHQQRAIFLDPHYVQKSDSKQQTYFKKHPRGIEFTKLSPCLSLSFCIEDQQSYLQFLQSLLFLEQLYPEYRAMEILLSKEKKLEVRCNNARQRKISLDDFQLLV